MSGIDEQGREKNRQDEFNGLFADLIDEDRPFIEKPDLQGIIRQVIARGRDSLSSKQEYRFKHDVADKYIVLERGNCGQAIEVNEVIEFLDNGKCSACQARYDGIFSS